MFDWLKRKNPPPSPTSPPQSPNTDLRELLFGDVPLGRWAANGKGEPWETLRTAADALARDDRAAAHHALTAVLTMPDLESRHYAEAANGLLSIGVAPSGPESRRVYGVIMDVPVTGGRDTLAGYEDGRARYLNFTGRSVVWDAPGSDREIDARVAALMAAGRQLAMQIGPWGGARPPLAPGKARVSLLTASGLMFGEGPFDSFSRDPLAVPMFNAGAALMQALTAKALGKPNA
jgi:hypothetical protein